MKKTIEVKANQSKRTFTIRCYDNGKMYAKYRTIVFVQGDFDIEEMNTSSDWQHFLDNTDEYYKI